MENRGSRGTVAQIRPALVRIRPDAERMLGIRRSKIYELIAAGELGSVTIGRCRLIPIEEIDAYVSRLRDAHGA